MAISRLPPLAWRKGALIYAPRQYRHRFIDLAGTYADYLGKFFPKSRAGDSAR